GEVVDRAMHGEAADVAARKKDRSDDEAVGRQRQAAVDESGHRAGGLVLEAFEHGVAERRQEQTGNEVMTEATAAAVAEQDTVVAGERRRAASEQIADERRRGGVVAHGVMTGCAMRP